MNVDEIMGHLREQVAEYEKARAAYTKTGEDVGGVPDDVAAERDDAAVDVAEWARDLFAAIDRQAEIIKIIDLAESLGNELGTSAGSWVFDGNSSYTDMRQAITWSDDGDPRMDEIMPVAPALPDEIVAALRTVDANDQERDDITDVFRTFFRDSAEREALAYAHRMTEDDNGVSLDES